MEAAFVAIEAYAGIPENGRRNVKSGIFLISSLKPPSPNHLMGILFQESVERKIGNSEHDFYQS